MTWRSTISYRPLPLRMDDQTRPTRWGGSTRKAKIQILQQRGQEGPGSSPQANQMIVRGGGDAHKGRLEFTDHKMQFINELLLCYITIHSITQCCICRFTFFSRTANGAGKTRQSCWELRELPESRKPAEPAQTPNTPEKKENNKSDWKRDQQGVDLDPQITL